MTQAEKAQAFADLHVPGKPIVLYNVWDAGGAKAIAKAGAQAVATGSLSVAAAHGYADGEAIPLGFVLEIVARITEAVDVPVTVDFEGAYAQAPEGVAANVSRVIEAGAIGINFEDQVVGGSDLYAIRDQCDRIAAAREAATAAGISFFINARTDLFLKEKDRDKHGDLVPEAKERAAAYAEAGASGFFVPALVNPEHIRTMTEAASLPVNVMMMDGAPSLSELASLNVARVSHGPFPFFKAMADLGERYKEAASST